MEQPVTLVIFSSEGREHLLKQSYPSFKEHCQYQFAEVILAIDGKYDFDAIENINPGIVVQQYTRKGYVTSIQSALNAVKTPYFFWLEDDYAFNQNLPIKDVLELMGQESWVGICLTKLSVKPEEIAHHYFDDLYVPTFGYSVSPTLCNTQHLKSALKALYEIPKDDATRFYGFEPFISDFFVKNNLKYAFIDRGDVPFVTHIGELESTGREYHMMNSIDNDKSDIDKNYVSGYRNERKLTVYNKIAMLPKLWYATIILSFKLLTDRRSYDFAFRIYLALLRGFKY